MRKIQLFGESLKDLYLGIENGFHQLCILPEDDTLQTVAAYEVSHGEVKARSLLHNIRHHLGQSSFLISVKNMLVGLHVTVQHLHGHVISTFYFFNFFKW